MAGTTNILQWNPTQANQETDAEYAADSQRSGGAINPQLFDATLANKLFYQLTTFLYALFTAFALKGFSTSDSNVSALTTQCANFLTSADVLGGLRLVSYSSSLVLDCSLANGFQTTLTGDVAVMTVSNATFGQTVTLVFIQDGVGGRTVAYPANVHGGGAPGLSPGAVSVQTFQVLQDLSLRAKTPMVVT